MKNQIKLGKAKMNADMLPMAASHIIDNIPEEVINALTTKQLTSLIVAMNKHFLDGQKQFEKEVNDFIGLPNGVDLWSVIGDSNHNGVTNFSDNLNIPDILKARGIAVEAINK